MDRKSLPLLIPFLLSSYPVLFLYAANAGGVRLAVILRPLGIALLGTLALVAVLSVLFRSVAPTVFLASVLLILFFSYGHVWFGLLGLLPINLYPFGWHWVLMPLWFVLVVAAVLATLRLRERLAVANRFLAGFAGVLVGMALLQIVVYEVNHPAPRHPAALDGLTVEGVNARRPAEPPDVYYLIFDEYANPDILRDYFGYDDGPFLDYLRSRGFYVAADSRANYPQTPLSLASSLNMQYLDGVLEATDPDSTDETVLYPYIEDHLLGQMFKGMGYRYVHISSGWEPTRNPALADLTTYQPGHLRYFEEQLGLTTWLNFGLPFVTRAQSRETTLSGFETVRRVPEMDGPTFVFAHFMLPHLPFVFTTEEAPAPPGGLSVDGVIVDPGLYEPYAPYLQQVGFTNRMIAGLVDDLLAASDVPPIIVIQSDHGYRYVGTPLEQSLGPEGFDERVVPILNAYYLPAGGSDALYPSITPVNSFRLILDTYFGSDLGLLPDKSYYADRVRLYDLVELPDREP